MGWYRVWCEESGGSKEDYLNGSGNNPREAIYELAEEIYQKGEWTDESVKHLHSIEEKTWEHLVFEVYPQKKIYFVMHSVKKGSCDE